MKPKCKYEGCNVTPRGKNAALGLCSKHKNSKGAVTSINSKILQPDVWNVWTNGLGSPVRQINSNGVPFNAVYVPKGGTYETHQNTYQVNDRDEAIVVIHDARYTDNFPTAGQMVSFLPASKFKEMKSGWNMYGGVDAWTLDADSMKEVANFVEVQSKGAGFQMVEKNRDMLIDFVDDEVFSVEEPDEYEIIDYEFQEPYQDGEGNYYFGYTVTGLDLSSNESKSDGILCIPAIDLEI